MIEPFAPLGPGDTLGRYRILERLGSGAMGDVYLAEDPRIERRLALKTVRLQGGSGAELEDRKRRLLREAKAAGRILHPNAVTLFDAGEDQGLVFLAFEYVEGQDLGQRLEQGPMPLAAALRLVRQVAGALDAAHRQNIIHRDIKPSNIFLTREGDAKIGDFGIAKLGGQSTELTQAGSVIGSPRYMSPEQVRGEQVDGRSDQFALGTVLYELLSGTRAFAGDTITTLVYQILHQDPVDLAEKCPGLPPGVVELVRRMMAKDREQRFATAQEVVEEITRLERSTGALRAGSSATPPLAPTLKMGSGGVPPPPPQSPVTPTGAAAPAPRPLLPARPARRSPWIVVAVLGLAVLGAAALVLVLRPRPAPLAQADRTSEGASRAGSAGPEAATLESPDAAPATHPTADRQREGSPDRPRAGAAPAERENDEPRPSSAEPERERRPAAAESSRTPLRPSTSEPPSTLPPTGKPPAGVREPGPRPSSPAVSPSTSSPDRRPSSEPQVQPPIKPPPEETRTAVDGSGKVAAAPAQDVLVHERRSTTVALSFRVEPRDAFILFRSPTERRFVMIGQAREYDTSTRRGRSFALPGPGRYYLLLRSEGYADHVLEIEAGPAGSSAPIAVTLQRIGG